jgi:hypothetical protein
MRRIRMVCLPGAILWVLTGLVTELHAAGLILENDYPWIEPFVAQRSRGSNDHQRYFIDNSGKTFSVDRALIERIVLLPNANDFPDITTEASLAPLVSKQTELEMVAMKVVDAKSYVSKPIAALEAEIRRFRSGDRKVNGKWLSPAEFEEFQTAALAGERERSASDKAAEAKWRALQKIGEEKRRAEQRATQEKRRAEQKATQEARAEEQKEAERQRLEKEKHATADLMQFQTQFQASEKRAAQSYQSSQKGTLAGQIFISTKGGENVKFGAIRTSLFSREAINELLVGVKNYAKIKVQLQTDRLAAAFAVQKDVDAREMIAVALADEADQQQNSQQDSRLWQRTSGLSETASSSDAAGKAFREAAQNDVRDASDAAGIAKQQYLDIAKPAIYQSGGFYFSFLRSPICDAETDADGKFAIQMPTLGAFVIAAWAERTTGKDTERYYWLVPVSLEGERQRVQNLSNNNLTSATDTSSLLTSIDK